jgi:hypothetical protein
VLSYTLSRLCHATRVAVHGRKRLTRHSSTRRLTYDTSLLPPLRYGRSHAFLSRYGALAPIRHGGVLTHTRAARLAFQTSAHTSRKLHIMLHTHIHVVRCRICYYMYMSVFSCFITSFHRIVLCPSFTHTHIYIYIYKVLTENKPT